jgi:hypothetical protein
MYDAKKIRNKNNETERHFDFKEEFHNYIMSEE